MATLTGDGATFKPTVRRLETTDPKHPDTWNPNYQTLIENDLYLKQRADQVDDAKGASASLPLRLDHIEQMQDAQSPEALDALIAAAKFALTQSGVNAWATKSLREQIQQEGELIFVNRGVVTGCGVTRSTTAARNLTLAGGKCFAFGRIFSVAAGDNVASVPSNTGATAKIVYAYLYRHAVDDWKLSVTGIDQSVPAGAIAIYRLTLPASNTDATDPDLSEVTLIDVRRIEPQWPQLSDSAKVVAVALNPLRNNAYRLDFDVVSATGFVCGADAVTVVSRAKNGFSVQLASAADNVQVRWRATKLND